MANSKWEGGQEVNANWFKFTNVGDGIKGTLVGKHLQKGQGNFADQWVYEISNEDGITNVGISVAKEGTVARLNKCKIGEIIGILFDKEGEAQKGKHPAKYLVVKTWGMDPNYNGMEGGQEVDAADGLSEV